MGFESEEPQTMWDKSREETSRENKKATNRASGVKKSKAYTFDDTGNANAFIDFYGDNIRYDCMNRVWMIYKNGTWHVDYKQGVKKAVDNFIEAYKAKLYQVNPDEDPGLFNAIRKNISKLSNNSGKESMLKEAQHLGDTPVSPTEFDTQAHLLNCKNGVVNLIDGSIVQHDRRYMMAKNTNIDCDMGNEPELFLKFMNDIFGGNEKMVDYMQVAIGYTLTGENREQCMFQCCGIGGNGKSVLMDVMTDIMGDYAVNAKVESVITKGMSSGGSASPDIARMRGARLIRTNEPEEGSRLNEGFVKQLVGGDVITARNLFGLDFEFRPVGKLWISTNHKLVIRGTDRGIWRRQQLIMFNQIFEGARADKTLPYRLREEYPKILGWAVKGAMKWYRDGLRVPAMVEDASKEYRVEMDVVANFLKDNVVINNTEKEKASDVYHAYSNWCKEGNEYKMSQTKFGIEMKKRFEKKMIAGYAYYVGFVLKTHDASYTFTREENL